MREAVREIDVRTGYYANAKKYKEKGYLTVAISFMIPRWAHPYVDHRVSCLAPTEQILGLLPDTEKYTERFNAEILAKCDAQSIYDNELAHNAKIRGMDKVVLLCYESAEKFCHRHLVAQWFKERIGLEVTEIGKDEIA